jgi:type II secretory pathway predicted ATPase ExeA/chromosome segregation ATPase
VAGIDDHTYCVVIDEHCHGEEQFYNEFLTQIGFEEIEGTLNELKNITKEFLVCRGIARDHVLLIFDNAHSTEPAILEQLRWLCGVKIKDRRPLSVVLAGNVNIMRVVDAPSMRQTRFRNHIAFGIRSYSEEETTDYVWHRLGLAGGIAGVKLPGKTNSAIHRYSGGIPRLINSLCDKMLTEAHNLHSRVITENIVRTAAKRLHLLPHVTPFHGKGRRKSDLDFTHIRALPKPEAIDTESLLQKITELSEKLEDLRADKAQALQDIEYRDEEIIALHNEFDSQTAKVEKQARSLASHSEEITKQNLALTDKDVALRNSENRIENLAANLESETQARKAAESELAKATATIEELRQLKTKLQATVDDIHTDLKAGLNVADERAANINALEQNVADLNEELDSKRVELSALRCELTSQNKILADLQVRLDQSQRACELGQQRIIELNNPQELGELQRVADQLAADLKQEKRARKALESELAASKARVEELTQIEVELHASMRDLSADLRVAGERAVEAYVLEKHVADLKDELDSRNHAFSELETRLQASQRKYEMLRRNAATLHIDDNIVSSDTATPLPSAIRSSVNLTQLFLIAL